MTQTRKWSVGAALLIVAVLVASWLLLISPKRSEAADLSTQAQTVTAQNQQLAVQLTSLKEQQKQLPEWQAQLAKLQTQIPESPALPSLIRELSDVANAGGVELTALTPSAPATLNTGTTYVVPGATTGLVPESLASVPLQLTVKGGYFQIQQFLNNVEHMTRVMLVTGVAITEDADTSSTSTTTTSSTKASRLSATIDAQVFLVPPAADVTSTTTTPTTTTPTTPTTTGDTATQ